jgi:rhodanese-related sulfurtransferase
MQIITVDELNARIQSGEQVLLVDVRESHEHSDFNIGGILHPLGRILQADVDELDSMKDKEVVIYCRSGNRSGQACLMLETMGFTNVKNLVGGMLAWRDRFPS